jgi:uncharacterized integral membrane protein (TIGR00697 family)
MLSLSPDSLIAWLQTLPVEAVEATTLLLGFALPIILLRLFGAVGVYAGLVVAILAANIQVLKQAQFSFLPDPVALGTAIFSSTYLAGDILTEYYGPKAARRGVYLGFVTYLAWVVLMLLTLGYKPLAGDDTQTHLMALFVPAPALFAAGMISYLVSELNDIWVFQYVKRVTQGRKLWLRTNASVLISALVDNTVFSTLAWVVFAATPVSLHTLLFTYILGTYLLRVVYSVLETPFMYLSRVAARHAPDSIVISTEASNRERSGEI